jgi:hypothetical protein
MKRVLFACAAAAIAAFALAGTAAADTTLADSPQLAASACGPGTVIVFALEGVKNDADSGVAGNAWAFDNYARRLIVVRTGPGQFCAITRYLGRFTTNAGTSPGGTGTVPDGLTGDFAGGYRTTTFTAQFTPTKPLLGPIGTVDYQCDTSFNCPGYVDWTTWYFNNGAGVSTNLAWWGWLYWSSGHGAWLNAIGGNAGDITG